MIEAVVQAGSFETAYRRAGKGGTVLLLLAGEDAGLEAWLFDPMAERFRTIAPDLPREITSTPGVLDAWLPALIDGLGLQRPALVAGSAHTHALLRVATREPDRIGRLLLLRSDPEGHTPGAGAAPGNSVRLRAGAGLAPCPVRVVEVPSALDPAGRSVALEEILDFLAQPA